MQKFIKIRGFKNAEVYVHIKQGVQDCLRQPSEGEKVNRLPTAALYEPGNLCITHSHVSLPSLFFVLEIY